MVTTSAGKLSGAALGWAVAKALDILDEPSAATWTDARDRKPPFYLYEVVSTHAEDGRPPRCTVRPIKVTRCGIDSAAGATAPSIDFIDHNGRKARGSIQDYYLTEADARAKARLIEAGGPYYEGYAPQKDWRLGGAIIERERIDLKYLGYEQPPIWGASLFSPGSYHRQVQTGPTPLIAAMRCLVAARLGDTLEIPEHLVSQA